jgi:glutamine cyclotransferase
MNASTDKVMSNYSEAYQKLYKRMPRELHALDQEWVIVNGARMRITELEYLTGQLLKEYQQSKNHRRNIVNRLINWLRS